MSGVLVCTDYFSLLWLKFVNLHFTVKMRVKYTVEDSASFYLYICQVRFMISQNVHTQLCLFLSADIFYGTTQVACCGLLNGKILVVLISPRTIGLTAVPHQATPILVATPKNTGVQQVLHKNISGLHMPCSAEWSIGVTYLTLNNMYGVCIN